MSDMTGRANTIAESNYKKFVSLAKALKEKLIR
jgi:hypothetical protein